MYLNLVLLIKEWLVFLANLASQMSIWFCHPLLHDNKATRLPSFTQGYFLQKCTLSYACRFLLHRLYKELEKLKLCSLKFTLQWNIIYAVTHLATQPAQRFHSSALKRLAILQSYFKWKLVYVLELLLLYLFSVTSAPPVAFKQTHVFVQHPEVTANTPEPVVPPYRRQSSNMLGLRDCWLSERPLRGGDQRAIHSVWCCCRALQWMWSIW